MLATGKPVIVVPVQRPAALHRIRSAEKCRRFSNAGTWARRPAAPSRKCCSATSIPGGKLPITIPALRRPSARVLQLQAHRRGAAICSTMCRRCMPFGYGLSYTTFAIANVRLAKKKIRARRPDARRWPTSPTRASARGSEVVQMYIRDLFSSVTRPVKELKGFRKSSLQPGETKTVAFDITPEPLAFYDIDMKYVVEPGDFEIMVGNSSRDCDLQKVDSHGRVIAQTWQKQPRSSLSSKRPATAWATPPPTSSSMTMILFQLNFYTDTLGITAAAAGIAAAGGPAVGRLLRSDDGRDGRPHQHALGQVPPVGAVDGRAVGRRHGVWPTPPRLRQRPASWSTPASPTSC